MFDNRKTIDAMRNGQRLAREVQTQSAPRPEGRPISDATDAWAKEVVEEIFADDADTFTQGMADARRANSHGFLLEPIDPSKWVADQLRDMDLMERAIEADRKAREAGK